jgi:ribosomal protein L16/L10AE
MLRRPRKPKFQRIFRVKSLRPWAQLATSGRGGCLQARRCFKLSWKLFELVRLRLAWSLSRRRRGSRKTQFKQRKSHKANTTRVFKRHGALKRKAFWYTGFPHLSYSAKAKGIRMGKGKGAVKQWYQLVRPGCTVLRLQGLAGLRLCYLLQQIGRRLPGHVCVLNIEAQRPRYVL